MKKFIDTLKNIWSIEELRKRILFTLTLLLIYRLGVQIVLPGIDANVLDKLAPAAQDGLLGMINMFAGGAFSKASIFALGIMPYISASIAMQLAQIAVPQIQKLQKEESGRKKVQMYTRYLTVIVTLFQAIGYISGILRPQYGAAIISDTFLWQITTVIVLVSGTLFVMWMGEKITDKGIGNGTSLLIMAGIIARFFPLTAQEWSAKADAGGGALIFLLEIAIMIAVIMAIVLLSQAVRRIPINYARRMVGASSAKDISGNRDFIPLKVNSAGVMPIIFAQAIMFIPGLFATGENVAPWVKSLGDYTSIGYNTIYFFVVIAFTYLYTAIIINPQQMADDLKRNNAFIPGVKPGSDTSNFIGMVLDRITLPGAVFLAIIGILPGIAALFGVTQGFAQFYGGTSMLIAVQVILDTLQQIESHLLMRHYDGLTDTGRLGGRQSRTTPTQVANG
jgi:preprotein translocase subunit SecY